MESGLFGLENLCLQGKMEKFVAVSRNIFLPQVLGYHDCTQDRVHQYLARGGGAYVYQSFRNQMIAGLGLSWGPVILLEG